MKISIGTEPSGNITLCSAMLLLVVAGCARSFDVGSLQCNNGVGCPTGYVCSSSTTKPGTCQPAHTEGSADSGIEGGRGAGSGGGPGGSLDGAGAGGKPGDAGPSGAGGAPVDANPLGAGGSPIGAGGSLIAAGGSLIGAGGSLIAAGGSLIGAGGSQLPPGSGGTASPDAPINSGPDAPTTLANGASCTSAAQCTSANCVDGVCCDSACDGQCQSCNQTGSAGQCEAVKGTPISPRAPCAGAAGVCQGQCNGSNKDCTFDNATVCASQSCSGGVRTNKSICDGKGDCPTQTTTTCADNQCTADGTDCSTCTDNPSATTCSAGHCGPTVDNCGNTIQCPQTCSGTGQTCGGGGTSGMCGCTSAK